VEIGEQGWEIWARFDRDVRQHSWHPFVPADYERVLEALLTLRAPGLRFLEWGSATGVITIMADLLGYEAYGIEVDAELVDVARRLAERFGSGARFAAGSFIPSGYKTRSRRADPRLGTIDQGSSAYPELGRPLEDFDLVYGYPWSGEESVMVDIMRCYGGREARLLINAGEGMKIYVDGRLRT
jgi:hypothetical protein